MHAPRPPPPPPPKTNSRPLTVDVFAHLCVHRRTEREHRQHRRDLHHLEQQQDVLPGAIGEGHEDGRRSDWPADFCTSGSTSIKSRGEELSLESVLEFRTVRAVPARILALLQWCLCGRGSPVGSHSICCPTLCSLALTPRYRYEYGTGQVRERVGNPSCTRYYSFNFIQCIFNVRRAHTVDEIDVPTDPNDEAIRDATRECCESLHEV